MEPYEAEIQGFIDCWTRDSCDIEAHTSGSTGVPKRVMLPRRLVKESAWRSIRHFGLDKDSVIHLILSPAYIAGKMAIVRALEAGCRLTAEAPSSRPLLAPGTPPHITLLSAVGAQLDGMCELKARGRLPHIRHLLLGGAPLTPAMRSAAATLAEKVWESYGMTETASHIALRRVIDTDPYGTSPFIPLDEICTGTDSRGCLVISMPTVGRIVTNDLVEMRADGGFRILGRFDNVIITGGLKVIPEKVEQALAPLFTRNDFYVSSRPHPKWGEELVVVVERPGNTGVEYMDSKRYFIGDRSLYALCLDSLAPFERPKGVIVLPEFRRTDSGKTIRQKF